MKNVIFIISSIFLLISCHSTKYQFSQYDDQQVFINGHPSEYAESGKCYEKSKNDVGDVKWTETICDKDLHKELIHEVQKNLGLLGYKIDPFEIRKSKFGDSTSNALSEFQRDHGYNYGIFDYATIGLLRKKSQ